MREELIRYHASIIPLTVRIRGRYLLNLFDFAAVRRSYLVLRRRARARRL